MTANRYTTVIIGTGFAGICMAIKLKERGVHDFVILEKAKDVGGTWRENTYPGAECDVPSALYSFSFESYPAWKYKWSHQDQILDYIHHCVDTYELSSHIIFDRELTSAHWDETESLWQINCAQENYKSKTLVTAIGQLHHPSTPAFNGMESFSGQSWHSAQWDHSVNLENKRIGVIGNGSSAAQFIPQIANSAKSLCIFQRSPNWILPKQDRAYKDIEKRLVSIFPFLLKLYRLKIFALSGAYYFLMEDKNKMIRRLYEKKTITYIKEHISDNETVQQLIPDYPLGARRTLFSDDYYQTLAKDNVSLITEPIEQITSAGLRTRHESEHELDVLIYATGFKSNPFLFGLDIKGLDQEELHKTWKNGPVNYKGMTISGFPNLFMMYGPNTNLGHNSILLMIEAQANYISRCVQQLKAKNWKSVNVKASKMNEYYQSIQERLSKMIWTKSKSSWYKSATGVIENNWPGRTTEYVRLTKRFDEENYEIV